MRAFFLLLLFDLLIKPRGGNRVSFQGRACFPTGGHNIITVNIEHWNYTGKKCVIPLDGWKMYF